VTDGHPGVLSAGLLRGLCMLALLEDIRDLADERFAAGSADPACSLSRRLETWFMRHFHEEDAKPRDAERASPVLLVAGLGLLSVDADVPAPLVSRVGPKMARELC
jgi:hypothetical protein